MSRGWRKVAPFSQKRAQFSQAARSTSTTQGSGTKFPLWLLAGTGACYAAKELLWRDLAEACGIVGVVGDDPAADMILEGLGILLSRG